MRAADLGAGRVRIGLDGVNQLVLEIELARIVGGRQAGADGLATERVDDLAHRPPHRAVERVDRQTVRAREPVFADRERVAADDVVLVLVDPEGPGAEYTELAVERVQAVVEVRLGEDAQHALLHLVQPRPRARVLVGAL